MVRNGRFDETQLLARIRDDLNARLPVSWSAAFGAPADVYADGVLRLNAGSTVVTFAVEVKVSSRPNTAQVLAALRAATQRTNLPLIFVTDYINAPLRKECERLSISYADATGWIYIASDEPPMFVKLEGAPKSPVRREREATTKFDGPATGRAIRYLLTATPPLGVRELAELSGSSPAAVSKLMPALEDAGAIERRSDGAIARIRRRTLLDRWTTDYQFLRSNGVVLDYIAPRGLTRTVAQLSEFSNYCVTGSAAARVFLPAEKVSVIPLTLLTVYARDVTQLARDLKLVRADRSNSNMMITAPRDLDLIPTRGAIGTVLAIAPLGQTLADLLTLPGRTAQEAEQLIEFLNESDPTWSE